ncbi:TM1812 family CRISPR-associated protein [Desulfurispira natronophila]|uniref:CRISPR-associated DxTHG motif protein n=1 Tax=Desulfurispira natronophila TaxID=682562 RepID=A0A7W7Y534_9BACT|nr:TM1812 family CRISPR-associated protein [Desulfurispira natronophila]MBB5022253.1 CRISPR-associated DxTHG motif protein [Desulfurispira natronophila]
MGNSCVITMLGTIRPPADLCDRAHYALSKELAASFSFAGSQFTNTLPLMVKLSQQLRSRLIPFSTKEALQVQKSVLEVEGLDQSALEAVIPIEEDNFEATFAAINKELAAYDEVILDVSHGFRHLPILATVSMIIHNITDSGKIRHILFAKEIEPRKRYEIIDLRKYLDIANVTYVLHTFDRNYTVAGIAGVQDMRMAELICLLQEFSRHILANSLSYLVRGNKSLLNKIRESIQGILNSGDSMNQTFGQLLNKVDEHLHEVQSCLQQERDSHKFFRLARLLAERGYLLNALTLLHEAIGSYALEAMAAAVPPGNDYSHYDATKAARGVFLHSRKWHATLNDRRKKNLHALIGEGYKICRIVDQQSVRSFTDLVREVQAFRNDLAHGNAENTYGDTYHRISKYMERFESLCITQDILAVHSKLSEGEKLRRALGGLS